MARTKQTARRAGGYVDVTQIMSDLGIEQEELSEALSEIQCAYEDGGMTPPDVVAEVQRLYPEAVCDPSFIDLIQQTEVWHIIEEAETEYSITLLIEPEGANGTESEGLAAADGTADGIPSVVDLLNRQTRKGDNLDTEEGEPETMVDTVPAGSVAATQFGFNTGFGGGGAFGGGGFNVQPHAAFRADFRTTMPNQQLVCFHQRKSDGDENMFGSFSGPSPDGNFATGNMAGVAVPGGAFGASSFGTSPGTFGAPQGGGFGASPFGAFEASSFGAPGGGFGAPPGGGFGASPFGAPSGSFGGLPGGAFGASSFGASGGGFVVPRGGAFGLSSGAAGFGNDGGFGVTTDSQNLVGTPLVSAPSSTVHPVAPPAALSSKPAAATAAPLVESSAEPAFGGLSAVVTETHPIKDNVPTKDVAQSAAALQPRDVPPSSSSNEIEPMVASDTKISLDVQPTATPHQSEAASDQDEPLSSFGTASTAALPFGAAPFAGGAAPSLLGAPFGATAAVGASSELGAPTHTSTSRTPRSFGASDAVPSPFCAVPTGATLSQDIKNGRKGKGSPKSTKPYVAHLKPGVTGHVTLRPGAFVHMVLVNTIAPLVETNPDGSPVLKAPAQQANIFGGATQGFGVPATFGAPAFGAGGFGTGTSFGAPAFGAGGFGTAQKAQQAPCHESWTICMDIRVAALPEEEPLPLLSCTSNHDPNINEVSSQLQLYPSGAVTVNDEPPMDERAVLVAGEWTRIAVRFGKAPEFKTTEDKDKKVLSVFVNGKVSVDALHQPEFNALGGRFSIPVSGFLLFCGSETTAMTGADLRFVEFSNRCLSKTEIRISKSKSVYEQYKSAPADSEIKQSRALQPLYKRPPPVWSEAAYIAEFGDASVDGTALAGITSVYSSVRIVAYVSEQLWTQQQAALETLSGSTLTALKQSITVLAKSAALARQYELSRKNPNQLIGFIRKWRIQLESMEVGDAVFVPGGFSTENGFSPLVLVLERNSEQYFTLAVVNPGVGSEEYHISSATSCPPKIQTRTTMVFGGVDRQVLLDDAWWMLFWRLGFTTGLSSSVAEFYDSLLPLLLKKPLDAALVDTHTFAADTLCPLRTNERATLTGYRCVREAWMFYLHLHGVRAEETLHVHFNYQLQWLKLLLQDLHLVNEVDESDIFLARLGPAKLTHYCTKRITTAEHPRLLDEQLRLVQETVDGIEARLSVMKITNYGVTSQALSLAEDVYTRKSLHNQLGPHLLEGGHGDGPPRVVETRSRLAAAEVVALYFSAHWCPPCREFTPLLRQVYSNLIESGKPFEVVFISADKSEQEFDNYFAEMPWLALPFASRRVSNELFDLHSVSRFPTVVLVNGAGKTIRGDGRQVVLHDPKGTLFPWPSQQPQDQISAATEHHHEFQRFLRKEDVNGLAGAAKVFPDFVPIDFQLIPERVASLEEGLDALRWADKLCTLLSEQQTRVKHSAYYKVAMLQHLFTRTLPLPECYDGTDCFWHTAQVTYSIQLDALLLLKRLMEHFASSCFIIRTSREFDAIKIVVSATMVTLGDVFLRKEATDIPSEVSQIFRKHGYGISPAPFDQQSETIITTMPELNIARTGVLDYWADLKIEDSKVVFDWTDTIGCNDATIAMLTSICKEMGIPYSPEHIPMFLSGQQWQVIKNFPELEYFRDVCFYHKFFLSTAVEFFPPPQPGYTQLMAQLNWQWHAVDKRYQVTAFNRELRIASKGHRWPSYAVASRFTTPHPAVTEDDILHIRELTDFEGTLGQRDTELLLIALTVPYLRIPLIVSFFATEDRIHALRNPTLRLLLDSVVFEPSRYLPKETTSSPEFVPAKDETRLNTPYGLLLNELSRSPEQVIASTLKLLKLALALDTGMYFESQDDIILYVMRLGCRVTSFVNFLLVHQKTPLYRNRDMPISPANLRCLEQGYDELSDVLDRSFLPMLHAWTRECLVRAAFLQEEARKKAEESRDDEGARLRNMNAANALFSTNPNATSFGNSFGTGGFGMGFGGASQQPVRSRSPKKEARNDFDALYEIVCDLRSHVILRLRNVRPENFSMERFGTLVPAMTFLYSRHTWNQDLLAFPETELFETFQMLRRSAMQAASDAKLDVLNSHLEATVAMVADSDIPEASRGWGVYKSMSSIDVPDIRQRGRFGVCETAVKCALAIQANPNRRHPLIDESRKDLDMGVEVNLQLCALSLKANHLQALNEPVSSDPDVTSVFGRRALQCAVLEEAQHRHWFRIIGREHDIQYWDPDRRADYQDFDRDYDPEELPGSEQWLAELFEPIRQQYYMPPSVRVPIPFVLPEDDTHPDQDFVTMYGLDPDQGGNILEVVLCKSLQNVTIFYIESFGRRFWRKQVYASDARYSTCFLQPSVTDRRCKWPRWGRYEAGAAGLPVSLPSAVITRGATLAENLAGTEEMYIPSRYLFGLIPTAILEDHKFWLDDNDVLRGYPDTKDEKTRLYEHIILVTINTETGRAHVVKRALQAVRTEWTEDEIHELEHTNTLTDDETGLYNENGARNRPRQSSRMLDRGAYDSTKEVTLMDPMYGNPTGKLRKALKCLVRIESMAFMLFWKQGGDAEDGVLDLIELPRLGLLLEERNGRLYSVDHADLFVCSENYLETHRELQPLVRGLPHSLIFVNSNDEPHVFLPLDRVPRPAITSSPFTTELVIDRVSWRKLTTRYLLLPVHVSLSFIRTPTLASSLYLLLLRFVNRDYEDLQRLVISVSTDTDLQEEEEAILKEISSVRDSHPDAHAARLHLTLSLSDAPSKVKHTVTWDIPDNAYMYICKLTHVSMRSRLTKQQERAIVDMALGQIAKEDIIREMLSTLSQGGLAEFLKYLADPAGQIEITHQERFRHDKLIENMRTEIEVKLDLDPSCTSKAELIHLIPIAHRVKRSPFKRAVLANRKTWLATTMGGQCIMELPTRTQSTAWQWWSDDTALTAGPAAWADMLMNSSQHRSLGGQQLFQMVQSLAQLPPPQSESFDGNLTSISFLTIYGLLTKTVKCKVRANDDSWTIAHMFWHMLSDGHEPNVWASVISLMLANPGLAEALPKFKDTRRSRGDQFLGAATEAHPQCPLGDLMLEVCRALKHYDSRGQLRRPDPSVFTRWTDPDDAARTVTVVGFIEDDRATRRPGMADCLHDQCMLRIPRLDVLRDRLAPSQNDPLDRITSRIDSIGQAEILAFALQPLAVLDIDKYVTEVPKRGKEEPDVKLKVPFDVAKHPDAQTIAAHRIAARLTQDMNNYETQVNAATHFVFAKDFESNDELLAGKLELIDELAADTMTTRNADHDFVQAAFNCVRTIANAVPQEGTPLATVSSKTAAVHFRLERYTDLEAWISVDLVIASLVCTEALADLIKTNPFLDDVMVAEMHTLVALALLHSVRIGQANRVLSECRKLRSMLQRNVEPTMVSEHRLQIMQLVESLAKQLTSKRGYVDPDTLAFDPRFLVFEFTWNILLFTKQIEMVNEFRQTVNCNGSMVRQLIMGSGKTTVISPLLCLMLADKKKLVVEAVPPALLEFSRSILRTSFSSVLPKRVCTFTFDRAAVVTDALLRKLERARDDGDIVVTTPTAIKALMLRYIENLGIIEHIATSSELADARRREHFLASQRKLVKALLLFCHQGTLLCDEIDMLLHPLRSELNFPIGQKGDLDLAPLRWQYPAFLLSVLLCSDKFSSGVGVDEIELKKVVPLAAESSRLQATIRQLVATLDRGYCSKALQRVPHLVLLDSAFYETEILPLMVTATKCWLEHQHFETSILGGLDVEHVLANKYLATAASDAAEDDPALEKHFKLLNLCADWLSTFLPHALQKIDRVTFGIMTADDKTRALESDPLMPRTRWKLAIPFVSKDVPSRSSEFAHPDVVIALTFLAYRYEGLRFEDFREVVALLRAQLAKEAGPVRDRRAYKLYERWAELCGVTIRGATGDGDVLDEDLGENTAARTASGATLENDSAVEIVALHLVKQSDEDQIRRIYDVMRRANHVIDYYLQEMVFPAFLRYQQVKISASGQEIGGDILFKRRIGFSGTPSNLLPLEMGSTLYEKGADGLMMTAMTDASIVSTHVVRGEWSVETVLTEIATLPYEKRCSALIDTGALITGMSNVQVAEFLLENGLPWCQGVVFLDDNDRKMVLVRATMRVVEIDQCGIKPTELFAVYDQIHTTGTDLPFLSTFNARAVQTLGKDMVWRDFVQGAWRMRRIQRGHTVQLLVIPEVLELICRELRKAATSLVDIEALLADFTGPKALEAVCGWLVINSMASERIQQQQLYMQNAANVWRKNAFNRLCSAEGCALSEVEAQRKAMDAAGVPAPGKRPWDETLGAELLANGGTTRVATATALKGVEVVAIFASAHWRPSCRQFTVLLQQTYRQLQASGKIFEVVLVSADPSQVEYDDHVASLPWLAVPFGELEITQRIATRFGIRGVPSLILLHQNGGVISADGCGVVTLDPTGLSWWPASHTAAAVHARETPAVARDALGFASAIECFHEPIDFSLACRVEEGRNVATVITDGSAQNNEFIVSGEDQSTIDTIVIECTTSAKKASTLRLRMEQEQVQEQEREQEQEQEQEQEREVEVEKFVDVQYSRDLEEPVSWPFASTIRQSPVSTLDEVDDVDAPFYEMRAFRLHKRAPLALPRSLSVSSNHFNPRWTGERRLKNAVCILEYVPDETKVTRVKTGDSMKQILHEDFLRDFLPDSALDSALPENADEVRRTLSTGQTGAGTAIERAFRLFDLHNTGKLDARVLPHILHAALDLDDDPAVVADIAEEFHASEPGSGVVDLSGFLGLLLSDKLRVMDDGRHYVLLSLAEAETVRRIMHVDGERIGVALRLRVLPMDFVTLDAVCCDEPPKQSVTEAKSYQDALVQQSLRFFDCELTFTEPNIGALLRGVQASPCQLRQSFFENVIGCRRRNQRKWQSTPLAKIFSLRSEFHLLLQRCLVSRLRLAIKMRGATFYEAFKGFDSANNGVITPAELFAALGYFDIQVTIDDVIDVMRACDTSGDQNLSWGEWVEMLRWNDTALERYDAALLLSGAVTLNKVDLDDLEIEPKGESEIAERWKEQDRVAAVHAASHLRERRAAEEQRKRDMEDERARADLVAGIAPNPDVSTSGRAKFDFTVNKRLPRGVNFCGFIRHARQPDGSRALHLDQKSYLLVDLGMFKPNGGGVTKLNEYTLILNFKYAQPPLRRLALLRTSAPTSSAYAPEITVDRQFALGLDDENLASNGQCPPKAWLWLAMVYRVGIGLQCYVNGVQTQTGPGEMATALGSTQANGVDAPLALAVASNVALFGSHAEDQMAGGVTVKSLEVFDRAIDTDEVDRLYKEYDTQSKWACGCCNTANLADTMQCSACSEARTDIDVEIVTAGVTFMDSLFQFVDSLINITVTEREIQELVLQYGENLQKIMQNLNQRQLLKSQEEAILAQNAAAKPGKVRLGNKR